MMYIKFVLANMGAKKTLRMPVGAGGRVEKGRMLVTVHERLDADASGEAVVVRARPTATSSDATFVVEGWMGGNNVMKQCLVSHREAGVRWTID
eukprot:2840555-Heterocapsa_arctica.AAC.1